MTINRRNFLSLAAKTSSLAALTTTALSRSAIALPSNSTSITGPASLRTHAAARHLLTGCAVQPALLKSDPAYLALILGQCSILVAENEMKWAALRPTATTYSFSTADSLVDFALSHRIRVRGHNLCWHEALPKWFAGSVNQSNARQVLTDHIRTVAGRYSGRIHSWDVVNEAIWIQDGRPDGLRKAPWLELAGEDYIDLAFRTAREADPHALLTYNDYGFESDAPDETAKRNAVLQLLRRLKSRGVPIDAVGIQSHLHAEAAGKIGNGLREFLAAAKSLDLQIFITEMDVDDSKLPPDPAPGNFAQRDQAVADIYGNYLNLLLPSPAVTAFLSWGITDRYSWLAHTHPRTDGSPNRPLLFDAEAHAKPSFFAVRGAFDARR